MQFTDADLQELQEILETDYGVKVAPCGAHEIAVSLVSLLDIISRENSTHSIEESNI